MMKLLLGLFAFLTLFVTNLSAAIDAPDMTAAITDVTTVFGATLAVSALIFGYKQLRRVI